MNHATVIPLPECCDMAVWSGDLLFLAAGFSVVEAGSLPVFPLYYQEASVAGYRRGCRDWE